MPIQWIEALSLRQNNDGAESFWHHRDAIGDSRAVLLDLFCYRPTTLDRQRRGHGSPVGPKYCGDAGVRGFGLPGDYNTRVLILIDGERINETVYDSALVGSEFPVDVDLIERVE